MNLQNRYLLSSSPTIYPPLLLTFKPQVVEEVIASGWIDGMLCTGIPPLEKQRFWYGDSGGPLFVQDNGTWTLVSLVSWNSPERAGPEGLYDYDMSVDVLFYVEWIRKNMV